MGSLEMTQAESDIRIPDKEFTGGWQGKVRQAERTAWATGRWMVPEAGLRASCRESELALTVTGRCEMVLSRGGTEIEDEPQGQYWWWLMQDGAPQAGWETPYGIQSTKK